MKTFQDFPPYNGLHWEPNGSRFKRFSRNINSSFFFMPRY